MAEIIDEEVLRRTQSTEILARPRRVYVHRFSRRSEGQTTRTTLWLNDTPSDPSWLPLSQIGLIEEGHLHTQSPFSAANRARNAVDSQSARAPTATAHTSQSASKPWLVGLFEFLGFGGPNANERREFVSLVWDLCFVLVQVKSILLRTAGN